MNGVFGFNEAEQTIFKYNSTHLLSLRIVSADTRYYASVINLGSGLVSFIYACVLCEVIVFDIFTQPAALGLGNRIRLIV